MSSTGAPEVIRAVIAGIEVVTIPVTLYAELLDCQRRLAEASASGPAPARRPLAVDTRSRLFDDPEVAAFLLEIAGTMRLSDARAACVDRFGSARAEPVNDQSVLAPEPGTQMSRTSTRGPARRT